MLVLVSVMLLGALALWIRCLTKRVTELEGMLDLAQHGSEDSPPRADAGFAGPAAVPERRPRHETVPRNGSGVPIWVIQ
ncbi:hypothetical protein ACFLSJ_01695 [Verrucomicrobiota bacterium]